MDPVEAHVAIVAAFSPRSSADELERFAMRATKDIAPVLEEATGIAWRFHVEGAVRLSGDEPRRASEFLEQTALRVVEGPYDATIVVTDAGIVSHKDEIVPGLASSTTRIAVLSVRQLRNSPRGESIYELDGEIVRSNATVLMLHLMGHLLGLGHVKGAADSVMAPFSVQHSPRALPPFSEESRNKLRKRAKAFPDRHDLDEGIISEIWFHIQSAYRNPRQVLAPVLRSRAPFLPLSLPRLTTTALVPTFILVFTAEIWDAGFHMANRGVWIFTILSIFASGLYMLMAQKLLLPRKERRYHTEHLAVANVAIVLTLFVGVCGLFLILWLLMLVVQIFIFPPDLIREWPSLDIVRFSLVDQLRIAALISTIGVLTGALGGGLESRALVRELALFESEP